jgi:hypothetical protein
VVAIYTIATALLSKAGGRSIRRSTLDCVASCVGACLSQAAPALLAAGLAVLGNGPVEAASNKVRITNLVDVSFGTVANLGADAIQSQSVCVYADTNTNGYNITGIGTGTGGSFQLSSGAASMSFDVLWNSSAGQTSGTQLAPNVPLNGQVSAATHQTCSIGPASSASLVVVVRAAALSSAAAGSYNGSLTLLVGAE